jgi:hypothetical protein
VWCVDAIHGAIQPLGGFPDARSIASRTSRRNRLSRSRTVSGQIDSRDELESTSIELLRVLFPLSKAVRLLGVSISGFYAGEIEHSAQIALEL